MADRVAFSPVADQAPAVSVARNECEPVPDESPAGVDRTLIHAMLLLTPRDRLAMLQGFSDFVQAARRGRERA
jgi:hypothetical protein